LVNRILAAALDEADGEVRNGVSRYIGVDGLKPFLGALAAMDAFVASSTGPLHLASAVGTPALGIYSPVFVCLPERWGPIGERDRVLTPAVPTCDRCVAERCPHFDCMAGITVEAVHDAVARAAAPTPEPVAR
jgi:ADP-heptose:LPS heptosyltransferase